LEIISFIHIYMERTLFEHPCGNFTVNFDSGLFNKVFLYSLLLIKLLSDFYTVVKLCL